MLDRLPAIELCYERQLTGQNEEQEALLVVRQCYHIRLQY